MSASPGDPAKGRPGWYPDPSGRWQLRWFNGAAWTADVAVDGQRFVDQHGTAPPSDTSASAPSAAGERAGAAAMVLGALALTFAWMPVFFVIGLAFAVAAAVVVVRTRRRLTAFGAPVPRLVSIGGWLAGVAVAFAAVGIWLTTVFVAEVERYTEIGRFDAAIGDCRVEDGFAVVSGSVENLSGEMREYRVVVSLLDRFRPVATVDALVPQVVPGASGAFTVRVFVGGVEQRSLSCEIDDVTGPLPFGVDLGFDISS